MGNSQAGTSATLAQLVRLHQVRVAGSAVGFVGVLAIVMGTGAVEVVGLIFAVAGGAAVASALIGLERQKRRHLRSGEPVLSDDAADARATIRRLNLVGLGVYAAFTATVLIWSMLD